MKWMPIVLLAIIAIALGLRLPKLADRPMHHDEANQAYRFGILLEEGKYEYDADDHHGPTLYYLTLPIAWITGAETFAETNETSYRILPVIFGLLLIAGTPLIKNGIGKTAVVFAALFTAVSPAMAYYSRFYIQEISLVFFTFMMIASGWKTWLTGKTKWAILCGISAGLMFATKETSIIAYAAMFGSLIFTALLCRRDKSTALSDGAIIRASNLRNSLFALSAAGLTAFVLFSSFFTNLNGPLESILAFKGYIARGTGVNTDHVHPWYFYLQMLTRYQFEGGPVWSERLVFGFGLLGSIFILLKKLPSNIDLRLARFLLFYTLLLTLAYSVISYKTPWCILSFLHGWILLGGIGVASALNLVKRGIASTLKTALVVGTVIGLSIPTIRLAHRTVFRYAADYRNPYVYAHTAPDFKNLVKRISEIDAVSPGEKELYIQVIADPDSTWPLPFYLREYPRVGFWTTADAVPEQPEPDIIISSADFETDPEKYLSEYYALRADTLLSIHISRPLWDAFIETRK